MSMAISIFVGRDPDDVAALRKELETLNDDRSTLIARSATPGSTRTCSRSSSKGLARLVVERLSSSLGIGSSAELADIETPARALLRVSRNGCRSRSETSDTSTDAAHRRSRGRWRRQCPRV